MKKFLIFLVSIVVVVCLGLTTYYFVRNNEIITVKTKEIYCNAGDVIPVKSLGIDIKKANISKKTKFNYNAAGEEVSKIIHYDETSAAYIVSPESGGELTLEISTTNKKYANFTIKVHIGDGSVENPYYIFNEADLMKIGSVYKLDRSYILMNDITLTNNFTPIGYNSNTQTWEGFNGTFDAQGYSIKGLNLNDVQTPNTGLFSSLGANAVVKNLTIENATISGNYETVGVLAGTINGNVEKIAIKNSSINNKLNGVVGALAGVYSGATLKLAYADNVTINAGEEATQTTSTIGGLIGKLNETTVQAVYTNNVTIHTTNAQGFIGGLVGEMVIGVNSGSIQQSYANTNSIADNYGALVGKISEKADFNIADANMLKHLIGNIAIVYGKENKADIADSDLVHSFNNQLFKKMDANDSSVFYMPENALYLVRGFVSAGEVVSTNEFIYYAVDVNTITNWDTTYVWDTSKNTLPLLKFGSIYPSAPSGEYFRRDFEQKEVGNKNVFVDIFSSDVEDRKIKLLEDVDLSNGWTPVAVKNTTIDGNNKTITINLNNSINNNLGLFTTVDNCTIKNLKIVVTNISANAENAGALAGVITSTDVLTTSQIENVEITFNNFATPTITNFGGIAGTIENASVINSSVKNLVINSNAQITNAGAVAAKLTKASLNNLSINATIVAGKAGGVVAENSGTITKQNGAVSIVSKGQNAGGVVAENNGTIDNVNLTVNISVVATSQYQNIGGVAGVNAGNISNVKIDGEKISIDIQNYNVIYIGGVAGQNNGTLSNINNSIKTVGTYYSGANHYVGGVVSVNYGTVKQVVTQSDLNGNLVAGVVYKMYKTSAVIDQVVVGKFDAITRMLSQNTLKADRYIAGIVVDFPMGAITNIQAASEIQGQTNASRSSLVALIFPYGATLKNATINSSFSGYGITYREVWTDFASYNNKAEFGLGAVQNIDGRFNLYLQNSHHGIMQSVVINGSNAGVSNANASMGGAFLWGKDYDDNSESSFIKVVDGFYSANQFQGSYEFVCAISSVFGIQHKATKTLTFDIGSVWESNYGISLIFVNDLI